MKFTTTGYMDLVMEDIGDGKIAMSHYYEQNGDLMADPDMTFIVDKDNKYLIGDSFQQDNLSYYEEANDNPVIINDFNSFTSDWLRNIKEAKYKVEQIYTNDKQYYMTLNPNELKQYCKDNGISNMFIFKLLFQFGDFFSFITSIITTTSNDNLIVIAAILFHPTSNRCRMNTEFISKCRSFYQSVFYFPPYIFYLFYKIFQ